MPLGGFFVANVAAFLSFLPLMQILLPLKAAAIAPGGAPALLGTVAAVGAAVAGAANFAAGWLSDRTRSRFGRRRPWIIGGAFGVAASYAVVWQAQSATALVVAFALFQLAFNVMFAPLLALIADRIPTARRGWVSALIALGMPLGTALGTVLVGTLVTGDAARYAALAGVVLIAVVPFAVRLPPDPTALAPGPRADGDHRWLSRNFALGWLSRIAVIAAHTVAQLYLLFYVAGMVPPAPHAAERGVALLGVVFGIVSSAAAVIAGRASDRSGRRRPFVIGGAVAVAAGMALVAAAPSWPAAILAYALFACGVGCHTAAEFAMMLELMPSRDRAARDLGVLNLSNIAPQIVAPLAATLILAQPGATIRSVFAAAAVAALAGATLLGVMRAVR